VKAVSGWQLTAFRWAFGLYLAWHFAHLLPWGAELFSDRGVLPDPAANPTWPTRVVLPFPLGFWDSPAAVTGLLAAGAVLALAFAAGVHRHLAAALLWLAWASLFARNNLIANPSLPYVGLLLLLTLLVPAGEPGTLLPRRARRRPGWALPAAVYEVAWLLLMAGYTYSGVVKLASPSWVDGSALAHLLANPLARDWFLRDLLAALPDPLLRLATWAALAAEILALPLALARRTRPLAWLATVALQLGILSVVAFADLTLGMLMVHLFVFDPDWLAARRRPGARQLVLYDGVCGLCDRTVQFLLAEDRRGVLTFAPLQGETAAAVRRRWPALAGVDSLVYARDEGALGERIFVRSRAVAEVLAALGGFWRAAAWPLALVPRPLADRAYDFVARNRYDWFGRFDACKLPTPEERARFVA
jgi:predicted DCC family thiol-disulfide oxidoreductase YuxK